MPRSACRPPPRRRYPATRRCSRRRLRERHARQLDRQAVAGNGKAEVLSGDRHWRLQSRPPDVPDYGSGSIAYIRRNLATRSTRCRPTGASRSRTGGCERRRHLLERQPAVPALLRRHGKRVAGLYRINGSCSKTAKLYVQHSGNYYRTGKNVGSATGTSSSCGSRSAPRAEPGPGVHERLDGLPVDDRRQRPLALGSVTLHNEHPDQSAELLADNIHIGTFSASEPPANPCTDATPLPTTTDPGTTILADNFESYSSAGGPPSPAAATRSRPSRPSRCTAAAARRCSR